MPTIFKQHYSEHADTWFGIIHATVINSLLYLLFLNKRKEMWDLVFINPWDKIKAICWVIIINTEAAQL